MLIEYIQYKYIQGIYPFGPFIVFNRHCLVDRQVIAMQIHGSLIVSLEKCR